jgi:hypothetical protein
VISLGLNAGGISALVAAVFWPVSAAGTTPEPDTTWGGFAEVPGWIIEALKYSARWNRWAALSAGVSALLITAALAWDLYKASSR